MHAGESSLRAGRAERRDQTLHFLFGPDDVGPLQDGLLFRLCHGQKALFC